MLFTSSAMCSADPRMVSPTGVISQPVVERSNRVTFSSCSSALMRRDTVVWFTASLRAAAVTEPSLATARQ